MKFIIEMGDNNVYGNPIMGDRVALEITEYLLSQRYFTDVKVTLESS